VIDFCQVLFTKVNLVQASGFRVLGLGSRVLGFGFRVEGLGFRV
jgi:hypothetical protein